MALVTDERGAGIPGKPDFLPAHVIPAGRIEGKNPLGWLKGLRAILEGRRMALRLFDAFQPSAVVGSICSSMWSVQQSLPSQSGGSGGWAPPRPIPRSRLVKTATGLLERTTVPVKSPSRSR